MGSHKGLNRAYVAPPRGLQRWFGGKTWKWSGGAPPKLADPCLLTLFRIPRFWGPSDFGPMKLKWLGRQAWCLVELFEAQECGEENQRVQHNPSNTHGDTARAVHQSHLLRPRLRVAWGWVRGGTGGVGVHWVMGNRNPPLTALPLAAAVGTCKCTACWQPIAGCRPSAVDQRPWRLAAAHSKLSWGAVGESSYTLTAPTRPMKDVGQSWFAVLALRAKLAPMLKLAPFAA